MARWFWGSINRMHGRSFTLVWDGILLTSIVVMIGFVQDLHAQPLYDIPFERVSTTSGLSTYATYAIVQDRQGFLWVGTPDGLNRYDGYQFDVFRHDPADTTSISDNFININALRLDFSGNLWIGTRSGGLNHYDPRTMHFTTFKHDLNDPQSLSHNNVLCIYQTRSGTLWIGTEHGLNRYNPADHTFTRYLYDPYNPYMGYSNAVLAIAEDTSGTLWIGTRRGLLKYVATEDAFIWYRDDPTQRHPLPHDDIFSLYVDRAGTMWIGTWGGGLIRFNPNTGKSTQYVHDPKNPVSLPDNKVMTIYEDRKGHLWIGTWDGGLGLFDPATEQFARYVNDLNDPRSLSNNKVATLFEDRTGILWVGTEAGLNKGAFPKAFVTYTYEKDNPKSLSHPIVSHVREDRDGTLWISTLGGGLNKVDRESGTFTHYLHDPALPQSLSHDEVTSTWVDPTGTLWISTLGGGINRLDPGTHIFVQYLPDPADPHSIGRDRIYTIYGDAEGILWIGTVDRGLNRFDPTTNRFIHYRHISQDTATLSYDSVWPIYEDHLGILWVGTMGGGLNRFDRDTETFKTYRYSSEDTHSIRSDRITSITEDHLGTLWVGTMGGGLNRFDRDTETFTAYTERDGLAHNEVACMLPDSAGNLWVSTSNGLSRFDLRTEHFANYGVSDGLNSSHFRFNACHKTSHGELLFGSYDGLVAFFPDRIRGNLKAPPIAITGFEIFNKPVTLDSSLSHIRRITLPHDQNFVAFRFAALDFTEPADNEYAYMLEGLDEDWSYVADRRFAGYPNLAPGRYTFHVKGSNNDGVWNEEGVSVELGIAPPYWKTWWFRLVLVGLLAGLLLGAYRYRVYQLLRIERTRQRIADDLHDDIGSKMSSIALLLEVVSRTARLAPSDKTQLLDLSQTARQLVGDLRDTVWLVDAGNDHLEGLITRMREGARQMLRDRSFCFEAPDALPPVSLEMEQRRHIFLVYKETLHNAVRHASASQISIRVVYEDGKLSICVTDNGVGFDVSTVRRGRGLRTLHMRAEQLGAELEVMSQPGEGTTIMLSVPLA